MQQLELPEFITYLQEESYFDDIDFIFYLKHLLYWQQPQYLSILCSIRQPKCLHNLRMLTNDIDFEKLATLLPADREVVLATGRDAVPTIDKSWKNATLRNLERDSSYSFSLMK